MIAVRLHGPRDLRVENLPDPESPGPGEVLLRVTASGICGSDLHSYNHARIGDTRLAGPLVLGHEFAGVVEQCSDGACDGQGQPLAPGLRVAVDPATPCGRCDMCLRGDPHICRDLRFCGLSPDDGCFRERLVAPARSCFVLPPGIDDETGAMLEPLGVAMHALERANLASGETVALYGAGPIGLLILQLARGAGAASVYVVEPLPWRRSLASRFGGIPLAGTVDPAAAIMGMTGGRGVDVTFEAAWADSSVQNAAESTLPGGRIVLVGIPENDRFSLDHSTARRKELSVLFSRRMKHTYPGAIRLAQMNRIDLTSFVTHRFPLNRLPEAFSLNAAYAQDVVKVIITGPAAGGV
ncbi:MAG TPA: alcohol dehydrogenase catalytic domain-containing protein [Bacteroidota bacterium]|nr:alcohol dehydrogenase catalytic domain-containing protein [Bacteroidota bacterium]